MLGRANLTVARVVEAHCDALAILHEAGDDRRRRHVGRVRRRGARARGSTPTRGPDGWTAHRHQAVVLARPTGVDHALVTAHVDDGRRLFRVDLRQPGVRADARRGLGRRAGCAR